MIMVFRGVRGKTVKVCAKCPFLSEVVMSPTVYNLMERCDCKSWFVAFVRARLNLEAKGRH